MKHCWAQITLGRWLRRAGIIVLLSAGLPAAGPQPDLETLARNFQKSPTAQNRAALLRFASAHPKDSEGALALLAAGRTLTGLKDYPAAVRSLRSARSRLPQLADYLDYSLARAYLESEDYTAALTEGAKVVSSPESPLSMPAVLLCARAHLGAKNPREAVKLLRQFSDKVAQPQGELLLASAWEEVPDLPAAAAAYQRVYYGYPAAPEAQQASARLKHLRETMGEAYPPPMPAAMLSRALALLDARQYKEARRELEELVPQLGGVDRETARVRIGVADYRAGKTESAYAYLKGLAVSGEADAERLYYLLGCARRLGKDQEILELREQLGRLYPASHWHLEALISAAGHFLLKNEWATYIPLYKACYELFPGDVRASACHWKVAWNEYLRRRPGAEALFREHLEKYPASNHTTAALYFLGRLAEAAKDLGAAKTFYEEIVRRFPNYFYAAQARQRLGDRSLARAGTSSPAKEFLSRLNFPAPDGFAFDFKPSEAVTRRVARAKLLASAALDDWAELELRYRAREDAQSHVLAVELARWLSSRGEVGKAIRYIKGLVPAHLSLPLEAAPEEFWQLAFPLAYRAEIEKYCRARGIDPLLMAALIRQESEFDPRAISRAKAYGLTQVLPSTGRAISRKAGVRGFSTRMLFRPDVNLNLGTYHLRSLLDDFGNRLEAALASYNAGASRVREWLTWAEYAEPAEFIESIPIAETRAYVHVVLRNADIYRRIYARGLTAAN